MTKDRNFILLKRGLRGRKRRTSHQAIVRLLIRMDRKEQAYVDLRVIGVLTRHELKSLIAIW